MKIMILMRMMMMMIIIITMRILMVIIIVIVNAFHQRRFIHDDVLHAFDRYSQVTFCIKGESLHIFSELPKTLKDFLWCASFKLNISY